MPFFRNDRGGSSHFNRGYSGNNYRYDPFKRKDTPSWRIGGFDSHNWNSQNYTSTFPDQNEIRFALLHPENRDNRGNHYRDIRERDNQPLKSNLRVNAVYIQEESVLDISIFYSKGTCYSTVSNSPSFESMWWVVDDFDIADIEADIMGRLRYDMGLAFEPLLEEDGLAKNIRLEDPEWSFWRKQGTWEVCPRYSAKLKVKKEGSNPATSPTSEIRDTSINSKNGAPGGSSASDKSKGNARPQTDNKGLTFPWNGGKTENAMASGKEAANGDKNPFLNSRSTIKIENRKSSWEFVDRAIERHTGMTVEVESKHEGEPETEPKTDKFQGKGKRFNKKKHRGPREKKEAVEKSEGVSERSGDVKPVEKQNHILHPKDGNTEQIPQQSSGKPIDDKGRSSSGVGKDSVGVTARLRDGDKKE